MSRNSGIKIDESLFKQLRPIFSSYLKRGFLISSRELNGDLEGLLPGESDWILEWFKEEFEIFYKESLEKHLKLVNENGYSSKPERDLLKDKIKLKTPDRQSSDDKTLMICPVCQKTVFLSDLNIQRIEKGKLIDCILYHPQVNGVPDHAIMMYLDQHLKLRGKKVIENAIVH